MQKERNSYEQSVVSLFDDLKNNRPSSSPPVIPVYRNKKVIAYLRIISVASLRNPTEIRYLTAWRKRNQIWFPSQFKVTLSGTKKWSMNNLIKAKDRVLFMVVDLTGQSIGHVGLYRFDFEKKSCEIDNIIRGKNVIPGVMTDAVKSLVWWSRDFLKLKDFTLKVFNDNTRALDLYNRIGFREIRRTPLNKVIENGIVNWKELTNTDIAKPERYMVEMKLLKQP